MSQAKQLRKMRAETAQMQQDIVLRKLGVPGTLDKYSSLVTLKNGDRDVKEESEKITYCVNCGSNDTESSKTGNGGDLFAAEDMDGAIEYFDDLELWKCITCEERFFK